MRASAISPSSFEIFSSSVAPSPANLAVYTPGLPPSASTHNPLSSAIAASPEIILADEPCGNLDSASGEEILGILAELNRAGKTIVMITHNEKTAKQAQRLIRISDGKIV